MAFKQAHLWDCEKGLVAEMAGKRSRNRNSNTAQMTTQQPAQDLAGAEGDMSSLTKEQLKQECKKRGQKTAGTKAELVRKFRCFFFVSFPLLFLFLTC